MGREAGDRARDPQWRTWLRGRRVESGCLGVEAGAVCRAGGELWEFLLALQVTGGRQSTFCSRLAGGNSCCQESESLVLSLF